MLVLAEPVGPTTALAALLVAALAAEAMKHCAPQVMKRFVA